MPSFKGKNGFDFGANLQSRVRVGNMPLLRVQRGHLILDSEASDGPPGLLDPTLGLACANTLYRCMSLARSADLIARVESNSMLSFRVDNLVALQRRAEN
jgi:hypothetical protein